MSTTELSLANHAGAIITAGMGLFGLIAPRAAAKLVGLEAVTMPGRSEFRATYGGFFLALGLTPIIAGVPAPYALVGIAWFGAAFSRAISIALDNAGTAKNFGAVAFEGAIGALLLWGSPWQAISTVP